MKVCDRCKQPSDELKEYVVLIQIAGSHCLNHDFTVKVDACPDCLESLKSRVYNTVEEWKIGISEEGEAKAAKPAETPCVVVYSHPHGMTVHACSSEEEAFRVGADIVLEQIDGPAEEDAQHILDLIRAQQFKEAIATYCEKMTDSAGMGESEIIELYSGEPTKALTAQRLAEKALNIRNDRFNAGTLVQEES